MADEIAIPVYIIKETEEVKALKEEIIATTDFVKEGEKVTRKSIMSSKAEYQMVINANDPKLVDQATLDVFYGMLSF